MSQRPHVVMGMAAAALMLASAPAVAQRKAPTPVPAARPATPVSVPQDVDLARRWLGR